MTPGKELGLEQSHMRWVWLGVFVVVAFFGYGLTPWETIDHLLENEGVGDEGATMIAFAAGYTLPLTVGVLVLGSLYLRGVLTTMHPYSAAGLVAVILFGAGVLAEELGLGLLPAYDPGPPVGGHPIMRLLAWVIGGYLNSYGWALALSAAAIGVAGALQLNMWLTPAGTAQNHKEVRLPEVERH